MPNPLVLPYVETIITTRCNLNCRRCANLVPYYNGDGVDIDAATIIEDLHLFFTMVDHVGKYKLIGGEPFLHPDFKDILNVLINEKKVSEVVISTNGTVPIDDSTLALLSISKCSVIVSGYGCNNSRVLNQLSKHRVNHVYWKNQLWADFGGVNPRGRSTEALIDLYRSCRDKQCRNFSFGEFHICPRSANGMNLGIVPKDPRFFAALRGLSPEEGRREIKRVLSARYINACNYCDGNTAQSPKILPGS